MTTGLLGKHRDSLLVQHKLESIDLLIVFCSCVIISPFWLLEHTLSIHCHLCHFCFFLLHPLWENGGKQANKEQLRSPVVCVVSSHQSVLLWSAFMSLQTCTHTHTSNCASLQTLIHLRFTLSQADCPNWVWTRERQRRQLCLCLSLVSVFAQLNCK